MNLTAEEEAVIWPTEPGLLDAALGYIGLGFRVFPIWPIRDDRCGCNKPECKSPGKHPVGHVTGDWRKNATTDPETIRQWWSQMPDANIATPDFLRIDVDHRDGGLGNWEQLLLEYGRPNTPMCFTPSGGEHWYFRPPTGWLHSNKTGDLPQGIDVRGHGTGYTLLPPSNHLLGVYEWELSSHPEEVELALLPDWLACLLLTSRRPTSSGVVDFSSNGKGKVDLGRFQLKEATKALILQEPSKETDRSAIDQSVICSLVNAGASDDEIKSVFDNFPIGTAGKYADKGQHAEQYLAHSIERARQFTSGNPAGLGLLGPMDNSLPAPAVTLTEKLVQIDLSRLSDCLGRQELGDGELMKHVYTGRLVYDHSERSGGGWHFWAGHYWQRDETKMVKLLFSAQMAAQYLGGAAELNRQASQARSSNEDDLATQLESRADKMAKRARDLRRRARMRNSLKFAESLLAVTSEVWDTKQLLLPVANGTVDLEKGELRPASPADFIRTHSPTKWVGIDVPCPRFERFVAEIMGGDMAMVSFLQRLLGYGISGLTTEHVFPIFWGETGRNGKDTLLETLGHVLGRLAGVVTKDVVMDAGGRRSSGSAEPHIYDLRGKRLVWVSEPKEGARLDAAQVKLITGGGRLKARPLYGSFIEWQPTHTVILVTNPRPHVPADDSALWSRIQLIPLSQRFVDFPQANNEHPADKHLKSKLKQEASGILAWLVRGFQAYQHEGLNPPDRVTRATGDYQRSEDRIGRFLAECCTIEADAQVGASDLYGAYRRWNDKSGDLYAADGRTFGQKMAKRFQRKHKRDGNVYFGIGLCNT